jgi:hypothetical protein
MGVMDVLFDQILRLIVYSFRSVVQWIKKSGTGRWACSEAIVTAEPSVLQGSWGAMVEVVYSYRVEGELYTGLHEEPFLSADSLKNYTARFSNGRTFVVRFKPGKPDHSVIRQQDQVMELVHS